MAVLGQPRSSPIWAPEHQIGSTVEDRGHPTPTQRCLNLGIFAPIYLGMKDPILNKLKDDAALVLSQLFLAMSHRPAPKDWRHPRENPPTHEMAVPKPASPSQGGLCYFHLN